MQHHHFKDEIAAKRAKLEALKKAREARKNAYNTSRSGGDSVDLGLISPSSSKNTEEKRKEIDELVQSLVGSTRPGSTGPGGKRGSRPESVLSAAESNFSEAASPTQVGAATDVPPLTLQSLSFAPPAAVYETPPSPIKEVVTYSKEVQTDTDWVPQEVIMGPEIRKPTSKYTEEELREQIRNEIEEELKEIQDNITQKDGKASGVGTTGGFFARELTAEEKAVITASEDFAEFIDRSSKVVERALDLDLEYDILADYGLGMDEPEDGQTGGRVREIAQFYDERWSKKRMISDIHFSPKHPVLVLAAYTKNPSAPHDPDGLVQVWNHHLRDRPEYVFHAQSDVLTARFSPFHPTLIIGGAYSGQVLLWDTRAKSQPVLKTPLTGSGHTHPVYSLSIIGTQNANNIISCSTDGVVCSWTVDMLAQPQESLELTTPPKLDDLAPTCMAFPQSDPTYFLVGTEEGTVYPCHRYDRAGAKAGVEPRIAYKGHTGPVMSVDFHPVRGPVDLGDLVLSSSLDWSVKLWKARPPAATASSTSVSSSPALPPPILEFSREDVVYDAKWNPIKPGVFGLVDGAGQLEIWDIAIDTEVPVTKVSPSSRVGAMHLTKSLNKLAWEEHEGKRVAVGGLDGMVTMFEVSLDSPRSEEWSIVKKIVGRAEGGVTNGK